MESSIGRASGIGATITSTRHLIAIWGVTVTNPTSQLRERI